MDNESFPDNWAQPVLFEFPQAASTGVVELFPAVWSAVEAMGAQEASVRHAALDRLIELGAPRLSPLVAYILATRLTDPDIALRVRVARILGEILSFDKEGKSTPEAVRKHLTNYLAHMRTRSIFSLLEAAIHDPSLEHAVAQLFNACPYAGVHLADILSDRKFPIPIRLQAVHFIGLVGFLDAIPVLERLETRLLARLGGQQALPFAPPAGTDESELLPAVQSTLNILRMR